MLSKVKYIYNLGEKLNHPHIDAKKKKYYRTWNTQETLTEFKVAMLI